MDKIILKCKTGGVYIISPSKKKFPQGINNGNIDKCKSFQKLKTDESIEGHFLIRKNEVPEIVSAETRDQFYHINDTLKVDINWENLLMPEQYIKIREGKRLNRDLDGELSKPNPDPIKIVRCQRNKEKLHELWNDLESNDASKKKTAKLEFYQMAMTGLDRRVSNGEPDKPIIREKLNQIISELS